MTTISGTNAGEVINDLFGSDTFLALGGDDIVVMFNDLFGANFVNGGGGIDLISYKLIGAGGLTIDLAAGTALNVKTLITDTLINIENAQGSRSPDTIRGNDDGNFMDGNDGDDTINGRGGADTLQGGAGNDTLIGGGGADVLNGGSGTDRASFSTATAGVFARLTSPSINTGDAKGDSYVSIENLSGSMFSDKLYGTNGANAISGGNGNDILVGLGGKDTLTGGAGADRFDFVSALSATTNVDRISDFNVAADTIRLDNAVMSALGRAMESGEFWKSTTGAAHDANDRIIYETDTGKLFYDSNGSAAGGSTHIATLSANLALTYADFLVI